MYYRKQWQKVLLYFYNRNVIVLSSASIFFIAEAVTCEPVVADGNSVASLVVPPMKPQHHAR